mmetsp:Transcript_7136/g.20920  ORF Transcript_7136/g.20920 Transcript_7136/m.20920 type:complete len:278 (-) Transcript_7136:610-1443(-)
MPVSFGDIAKTAQGVLNDDYKLGKKFLKAKSKAGPVSITTENTLKTSKDGKNSIEGKVSGSWGGIKGFKVSKVAMDAGGKGDLELALDDVVDGLGFTFKASLFGDDASLEASYEQPQICSETALDLNFSSVSQSLTFGFQKFTIGGEFDFDIENTAVSDYNIGANYTSGSMQVAAFTSTTKKGATEYNIAASYPLAGALAAATASFDTAGALSVGSVGAKYAYTKDCTVRAAVDTNYHLKKAICHKVAPGVKATACVDLDLTALGSVPAYGVNLQLG